MAAVRLFHSHGIMSKCVRATSLQAGWCSASSWEQAKVRAGPGEGGKGPGSCYRSSVRVFRPFTACEHGKRAEETSRSAASLPNPPRIRLSESAEGRRFPTHLRIFALLSLRWSSTFISIIQARLQVRVVREFAPIHLLPVAGTPWGPLADNPAHGMSSDCLAGSAETATATRRSQIPPSRSGPPAGAHTHMASLNLPGGPLRLHIPRQECGQAGLDAATPQAGEQPLACSVSLSMDNSTLEGATGAAEQMDLCSKQVGSTIQSCNVPASPRSLALRRSCMACALDRWWRGAADQPS